MIVPAEPSSSSMACGKRVGGRRAARAVGVFLRARGHRRRVREKHGRGVHDRRIDEAEEVARIVAGMRQPRVDAAFVETAPRHLAPAFVDATLWP